MTDPPEDGDQPEQPAYGPAGPPPPPGTRPQPYTQQPYTQQPYAPPQYPHPYQQQYAPPPYGQSAYGQQYGTPEYGQQYGQQPHYSHPQYAQPQYAQPQYGSSAPPVYPAGHGAPDKRRRSGLLWALVAVVVAAVAIAVLLSFTLRTRVLNRSAVERDVAAQFQEHEGVAIRLDCSDPMALTTGATYRCQGTTAAGERVTLLIRVTDSRKASYTWSEQR